MSPQEPFKGIASIKDLSEYLSQWTVNQLVALFSPYEVNFLKATGRTPLAHIQSSLELVRKKKAQ